MKTIYSLFLAVVTALGTSLGIAQDDRKPNPPTAPDVPPNPPGAERSSPPPDRQRRPEGERPPEHSRRPEGDRSPDGGRRPDGPRPSEGDRQPDGGHNPGSAWHMPVPPPAPPKPTSYLGVVTSPLPPALSAQLSLAEGFGLVVGDVLPDSPAAKAGIQRYDVLTKFNDQQLIDAGQFSTLVRAQTRDSDATLTLFRKAQEQKVSVKVGERMMPERRPFPSTGDLQRHFDSMKGQIGEGVKQLQDRAHDFGDRMREFQKRMQDWQKNPSAEMPRPPEAPSFNPADILREVQPGGVAQIRLLQPNGTMTYNTASAKVLIKEEGGEMEIGIVDGKRTLVARNADGVTVFNGPIDTEEQRKALPEIIRNKLKLIEVRTKIAQFEQPAPAPQGAEPEVQ